MSEQPKLPALTSGGAVRAIVPQSLDEAWRIATAVVRARMAPRGIDTPEQATVIILHGLEVGLTPMAALQSIALINGKPSLYGDGILGVVRASGLLEKIDETCDGGVAACCVKRRGEASLERTFSEADAKRAGLWGKEGPWKTYPNRMLLMRARGFALRDAFADVLKGLISREEAEDIPVNGRTTPPPPAPQRDDGPPEPPPPAAAATIAREDGRERPGAEPHDSETGEVYGTVTVGDQVVDARILSDAELVAELEAGRDDGATVEWHEEEPPVEEATAEDVFDISGFLRRLDKAYSECHNLTRLHAAKDALVPPVIEQIFPPDRTLVTKVWQRHYVRIAEAGER